MAGGRRSDSGSRSHRRPRRPAGRARNPYDPYAIAVWIDGAKVGHLCCDDAEAYRPGLLRLQAHHRASIAVAGVVVSDGPRQDDPRDARRMALSRPRRLRTRRHQ